eukprot:3929369-Rhodomonas_salina.1
MGAPGPPSASCVTQPSTLSHIASCHALNFTVLNTPCMTTLHQPWLQVLRTYSPTKDKFHHEWSTISLPALALSGQTALALRDFVPDGIIITHAYPTSKAPSRVVIIEFARSYTIEHDEMVTVGAAKRNQYHHLERFLLSQYPDHEVSCQSYIVSVLGVYPQQQWISNCNALKFTSSQTRKLQLAVVR